MKQRMQNSYVWRRKYAQGEVVVIRFADDTIAGFQFQTDADHFLENFRERLGSLDWNCILTKRAGLSSVGLPNKTGNEEVKASRKRSTF